MRGQRMLECVRQRPGEIAKTRESDVRRQRNAMKAQDFLFSLLLVFSSFTIHTQPLLYVKCVAKFVRRASQIPDASELI
jgi:hypothetical protein